MRQDKFFFIGKGTWIKGKYDLVFDHVAVKWTKNLYNCEDFQTRRHELKKVDGFVNVTYFQGLRYNDTFYY